jgi:ethanolamine utilization protein EutQ
MAWYGTAWHLIGMAWHLVLRSYYYDYEELKFIVSGEFHLTDGTGQKIVAKAGDLVYFPNGTSVIFDTPSEAIGCFTGQRPQM